jgi:transcriptional regulator with XRE-family HTH domain
MSPLNRVAKRTSRKAKRRKPSGPPDRPVDKSWFQGKLRDMGLSQRRLAAQMQLNHAALSLMFQGQRNVSVDEAAELARLLGVSVNEICNRLGVELPARHNSVSVKFLIDETGKVNHTRPRGPTAVAGPVNDGGNLHAARYQTASSSLSALHNWTLFWEPSDRIQEDAIGSLCIIQLLNKDLLVRVLNKGAERGTFDLTGFGTNTFEPAARLLSASPVLWIKC